MKKAFFFIIIIILLSFIVLKFFSKYQFSSEVKHLFAVAKNISGKTFSYEQIKDLPAPVQGYFKHVLKEGQPYVSLVRITHDGEFRPNLNGDWVRIKGEQYFSATPPGFVWKGETLFFTARDMYLSGSGRLVVKILNIYPIVDGKGKEYDQGELLRWLGECLWFPTNLLPSENLNWVPIDEKSSKLILSYNGLDLYYIVKFNDFNEISEIETKRYMDQKNIETWIGRPSDYKEKNGIIIPMKIEAIWRLDKGEFSYAKFNLRRIEFDIAEMF